MERPESVSRVAPPTRIMATIRSRDAAKPDAKRADMSGLGQGACGQRRGRGSMATVEVMGSDSGLVAGNSIAASCPVAAVWLASGSVIARGDEHVAEPTVLGGE